MVKHAMKYGVFIGVGLIIFSLLLYFFGLNQNEFQFPGYIILALGIVAGVKQYRTEALSGFISYRLSLKTGTAIALFSAFLFNFYTYIFYKFIDPSQLVKMLEQIKIQMASQGRSEEETDLAMSLVDKFVSPGWLFISGLFGYTFIGFIFSLISSFFLKKESSSSFPEQN